MSEKFQKMIIMPRISPSGLLRGKIRSKIIIILIMKAKFLSDRVELISPITRKLASRKLLSMFDSKASRNGRRDSIEKKPTVLIVR